MSVRSARLAPLVASYLAACAPTAAPSSSQPGDDGSGTATLPTISDAEGAAGIDSVQAWIYPGPPACDAQAEYADGRAIDVLKPEYFTVAADGSLRLLEEADLGCNGYSADNAAHVRSHSARQYVTVSAHTAAMREMLASRSRRGAGPRRLPAAAPARARGVAAPAHPQPNQ